MNFSEIIKEETKWTKTENGADCKNTTNDALLDFFATVGAMREWKDDKVIQNFELSFLENPLYTIKALFYARDIRGGLGERKVFRILIKHMTNKYSDILNKNIELICECGRYDDLYELIGTKSEDAMWSYVHKQLIEDVDNFEKVESVSLLAKWLKKADSKNKSTKELGIYTAKKLGYTVYEYKRICNKLRKYINVTEIKMSNNEWADIEYSKVPSKAMNNYRNAFGRHDEEGFSKYIENVSNGVEKINASTLYPYDIVEKILYQGDRSDVLKLQWEALPNYVDGDNNILIMADVSGSMTGRPMATSIGLAMYFAERNKGAYHNLFMTFSANPQFVEVKGSDIYDKIGFIKRADWNSNTDLHKAMMKILELAIANKCSQEEIPKALVIVSDMQIDSCIRSENRMSFYDIVSKEFEAYGYKIPNLIFWNVNSPSNSFLADKNSKGVQLVSGSSASTFKSLIDGLDKTAIELMYTVLDSERYSKVTL